MSVSDNTLMVDPIPLKAECRARNHQDAGGGSVGGGYRVVSQRSAGADGAAFDAVDESSGELVDLRRIGPAMQNSARRDAVIARLRLLQTFGHSAVLAVRELCFDRDPPFVAMEKAPETTLGDWIATGNVPARDRLIAAQQLCSALVAAHQLGLPHGCLSLDLVFVDAGTVRMDFSALATNANCPAIGDIDDDLFVLSQLLSELLDGISTEITDISRRHMAALHQLLRNGSATERKDRPLASEFAKCVDQLLANRENPKPEKPECGQLRSESVVDADRTSEIVVVALEGKSNASSEIDCEPGCLESTAETIPQPVFRATGAVKPRIPVAGDQLGRYRVVEKIGEGGMGAVFKAIDRGDDRPVAIKTLNASVAAKASALLRFQKECRLLAALNNPYVTNLVEVNENDGLHFMVLEFVEGTDLKKVLSGITPLPEAQALSIAADVSRALVDAHERGIVHRDIKPENILLSGEGLSNAHDLELKEPIRVKLSDFGIARYVDQSESLAVTQAGAILGTPRYMSPEQCKSQGEVLPQSDVYSLGVTLFEMLTGAPPFLADDPMKLAAMHCFDAPPSVAKKNPRVSEAAAAIVAKALAKRPEDRYADAAHMLRELDQLLRGEPSDINIHPLLPEHDPKRLFRANFVWELQSSADDLWPYVSNTERLNRAIGLPAVNYRTEVDPDRGVRKFGSFKLGGLRISWEEHPFEWIEGRRMGILREFDHGPFKWFMSVVELERLAGGGTQLYHRVCIAPRNLIGRILAKIEAGIKARKSLDRVYRRIDETLHRHQVQKQISDPFEPPNTLPRIQRQRLEERLERLVHRGVSLELSGKLGEFIASSPAQEVAKIAPLALAELLGHEQDELLDACLLASAEGLLSIKWDILCPTCRVAADTKATLKELQTHTFCEACNVDFDSDLANSVELVFRAHADLRDTQVGKYCIGGPEHSPHVVAQIRIAPEERIELELSLPVGEYLLRGPQLPHATTFRVREAGAPSHCEIVLDQHIDPRFIPVLRAGKQLLRITNGHANLQLVRVERTISRQDVVTAAQASSLPTFRSLFPGEVLDQGRLITTEQVTLLITGIGGIDSLYEALGDAQAYGVIQQHLEHLEVSIREGRGAVVKTLGEGVVAAFDDVSDAVETAFCLPALLDDGDATSKLQLSVGVHRGPAIVTTVNDRLDYFGATARIATALPAVVQGCVLLTEPVFSDPAVAESLNNQGRSGDLKEIDLPGKPNQLVQIFGKG